MRKNHLTKVATAILKSKGSKFLSFIYKIEEESQLTPILQQLKKEHHAARHWCYAYRLGNEGDAFRTNDDGEPSGTAGRPILQQIDRLNLTNVLVVVVRYFGGTLLGVRGLIDAYGGAAAEALAASTFEPLPILNSLVVKSHYERFAELQKILNETGLKPEITYDDDHLIMTLIADQELIAIASEKFKSLYDIQIKVN